MSVLSAFSRTPHPSRVTDADRAVLMEDPGFGRVFTDHMVTIRYTAGQGWHSHKVEPRGPIPLDPAASVLHYAQEIFEGMKAYKTDDGRVALFRPEQNARRFQASAERLAMPQLPEDLFIEAVSELVKTDADWIPDGEGSLYLRPFMIATEAFLGVRAANEYLFVVLASPVGGYFKGGKNSVTIRVSEHYTRAARGGTGAAKCGGNYAASLVAQAEAVANGCDQVVFLDAAEGKWIEELGGMNIFFVFKDGSLQTPPLGGTILPGVTRASILQLARDAGVTVREAPYAFEQWRADVASGDVVEAFACGTAAVLTAISKVVAPNGDFVIGDGKPGPVTTDMLGKLVGIQRGRVADPHNWVQTVIEA